MAIENAENKIGTRYAADIDASVFTPDSNNAWEISGFCKSFLPHLKEEYRGDGVTVYDQCRGVPMTRVTKSQIMLGFPGSMTGFHVEDFNFASVNYHHTGAPKHWILIPSPLTEKARALFKRLFPEDYVICEACDLHKRFFVFPQLLTLEEIPYHTIRQGLGDYVFTIVGRRFRRFRATNIDVDFQFHVLSAKHSIVLVSGPSKRKAKQVAAKNMLIQIRKVTRDPKKP